MGKAGVFGGLMGKGGEEGVTEAEADGVLDEVTSALKADGLGVTEADATLDEADGMALASSGSL
jgi:hypothetical protein